MSPGRAIAGAETCKIDGSGRGRQAILKDFSTPGGNQGQSQGKPVLLPRWHMQGPGSADHLRQIHLGTRDENQEARALT